MGQAVSSIESLKDKILMQISWLNVGLEIGRKEIDYRDRGGRGWLYRWFTTKHLSIAISLQTSSAIIY